MAGILGQSVTYHNSGVTAPNRFLKSAMTERICSWSDTDPAACGKPTPEYTRLYEEWGKGQIGTIILGNVPCDARFPEAKGNAVADPKGSWDQVEAFKPVIAAAKANGSVVLAQITHAGRQTSTEITDTPVSSSDVQSPPLGGMTFGKPRPLTLEEIADVVKRFAFAAKVMHDAGAHGVQLHGAHGYLLSQFLSPRVNKRTDRYGGDSLDNRSRIVFEIVDAIKTAVNNKNFLIAIKINSADFSDGGFSAEESREIVLRLEAAGLDLIELSGGTYESLAFEHKSESTRVREAFFIEFAERIRPNLKTARLAVTGGFRSVDAMVGAVESHATDIIGLARPLTAEPHFCADILSGKTRAAKPNHVHPHMQTGTSVFQIHEIGRGQQPSDLSDERVAKRVLEAVLSGKNELAPENDGYVAAPVGQS